MTLSGELSPRSKWGIEYKEIYHSCIIVLGELYGTQKHVDETNVTVVWKLVKNWRQDWKAYQSVEAFRTRITYDYQSRCLTRDSQNTRKMYSLKTFISATWPRQLWEKPPMYTSVLTCRKIIQQQKNVVLHTTLVGVTMSGQQSNTSCRWWLHEDCGWRPWWCTIFGSFLPLLTILSATFQTSSSK